MQYFAHKIIKLYRKKTLFCVISINKLISNKSFFFLIEKICRFVMITFKLLTEAEFFYAIIAIV